MVTLKRFGSPIETFAFEILVTNEVDTTFFSELMGEKGELILRTNLKREDEILGLGQTMGHFQKRGEKYISFNVDNSHHEEGGNPLYGSHNFFVVDGKEPYGVFVDTPGIVTFNFDSSKTNELAITCENPNVNLYIFTGNDAYEIVKEFLHHVGIGNIPPLWAFGFIQSRWGYKNKKDIDEVERRYKEIDIPLSGICMDIDYMDRYIDFTLDEKKFPNFEEYVKEKKEKGIHLIPIIDAGMKVEPGNSTYEEGIKGDYFVKNKEGKPFRAAVWPGYTHFADFFQSGVRNWFGEKYKFLTDMGIDGFWNDMNEPSIFYSEYTEKAAKLRQMKQFFSSKYAKEHLLEFARKEYESFTHKIDGQTIKHMDVHNVYGALMTKAAGDVLKRDLTTRYLLFSRSSYIGASRSGGIWTGDNTSSWDNLRHNFYQMPALNLSGFLYSGADTGGFMGNTNEELALRWHALSCFTPLFRNHCSIFGKKQECYRFKRTEDFRNIIRCRYKLIPYLYSEFVKATLSQDMFIKPLRFVFSDERTKHIEDELMIGSSILFAPIMEKGITRREVYLPEDMTMVRYSHDEFRTTEVPAGTRSVEIPLSDIVFFVRDQHMIPVLKEVVSLENVNLLDTDFLGNGNTYLQYVDDGYTKDVSKENIIMRTK